MEFAEEEENADPEKLIEAFEKHCIGEVNEVYERYVFNRRQQEPSESFDTFVGDLRRLVKSCGYGNVEDSTVEIALFWVSATTRLGRSDFKSANSTWRKRLIYVVRRKLRRDNWKLWGHRMRYTLFDNNLEHRVLARKVDIGKSLHDFATIPANRRAPTCEINRQDVADTATKHAHDRSSYVHHTGRYVQNVRNEILLPSCASLNRIMPVNTWLKNRYCPLMALWTSDVILT